MNNKKPEFEVGIIGGGPAGASMAAYLAKAGIKCVVFESELFPRPHVGESLVPSSTRVFKEIDFLDQMEEHKFVHKYGAVWTAASNFKAYTVDFHGLGVDCRADIRFDEREQPGVNQNYTYHVDRAKFDQVLLQHAHKLGATVQEGIKVRSVDFSDHKGPRVNYSMGKKEMSVGVRVVVDASGRRTFLGKQLKLRVPDRVFDQFAIYTYFEDFDRTALTEGNKGDHIFIHFLPVTNTWVWQIPISETVTSIGVVTQKRNFASSRASRETFFWDCVKTRPELYEALKKARHVPPFYEEGDYSYAMKQICGNGFVLIGDAARFVDPIFSTGVSIALNSARFASKDIIEALQNGGINRESFKKYETTIRRGTNNWYNFISVYYRLNILFTAFINDPRYRLDVLKLLQGDVYDEDEPAVLKRMRDIVTAVEQNQDHVWHKLLGNLTADAFKPVF
jgi:1H-pyrrole-2-carbonyl-[peptidyl-carrier protein] chlorinase